MQIPSKAAFAGKVVGLAGLAIVSGLVGAALASKFGTSSMTVSYIDFISVVLTCLGVMLTAVTLFVGVLAVIGWTSIETRLRSHSIEFIGSELTEDKPLGQMVRKAVREAVYEGVVPAGQNTEDENDAIAGEETAQ